LLLCLLYAFDTDPANLRACEKNQILTLEKETIIAFDLPIVKHLIEEEFS